MKETGVITKIFVGKQQVKKWRSVPSSPWESLDERMATNHCSGKEKKSRERNLI